MASKQEIPGQGAMFTEVPEFSGTDPHIAERTVRLEINDAEQATREQSEVPAVDIDPQLDERIRRAVATTARRKAQTGRHSPLQRDGSYNAVRAGDVLPDFGVVTYSNLEDAKSHAAKLQAERYGHR